MNQWDSFGLGRIGDILSKDHSFKEEIHVSESELEALRDLVTELESKLIVARQAFHALRETAKDESDLYIIDAALARINGVYESGETSGTA